MHPILVLALVQSVPVSPPPAPPAMTRAWAATYAAELKSACMSDAGIAIAVESWQRDQDEGDARQMRNRQIETELGEAAYTIPIDVARLERAARARDAYQAERLARVTENGMAVLKRLSPADRAIYAQRFAIYRPDKPAPSRRAC